MDEPRLRRLRAWFKLIYTDPVTGAEDRGRFIADTGRHGWEPITKGLVSQWLGENGSFGEVAAKKLGLRLGKGEDYFLEDRPEFGPPPQGRSRIDVELSVLADLRAIERERPEMYDELLESLKAIAAGLRASRQIIKQQPGESGDQPRTHDELLGGTSGFGVLDEEPAKDHHHKKKRGA
jgi:hypothetical protein